MPTSNLNLQFTVTNVAKKHEFDTRQLIKKDIPHIRFNDMLSPNHVNIAYIFIDPKDINDNVSIIDKSNLVPENNVSENIAELNANFTGPNYTSILSTDFLVTDTFTTATVTEAAEPIFYEHEVPYSVGTKIVVDFEVLDEDFNQVNTRLFIKNTTDYLVYTNLNNSYDQESGLLVTYYVRYHFNDSTHTEALLNVKPIFKPATYLDLDGGGDLISGTKRYILDYSSVTGTYTLKMPDGVDYALKYTSTSYLELLYPNADVVDRLWFLRVKNGEFVKIFGDGTYQYNIIEYSNQAFNPFEPYKFALSKKTEVLVDNIIQVPDENLQIVFGDSLHIDVVIKDSEDNPLYAASTVAAKHGVVYSDHTGIYNNVIWNNNLIHSYDENKGFVKLTTTLSQSYNIYASYYYIDSTLEISTLNINPISVSDITKYRIVVYVVPAGALNTQRTASIYYLHVDTTGTIVQCSQNSTDDGNLDLVSGAVLTVADVTGLRVGLTITGQTSNATGIIIYTDTDNDIVYLRSVTDTFVAAEIIEQEKWTSDPTSETAVTTTINGGGVQSINILSDGLKYDDDSGTNFLDLYTTIGDDSEGTHYMVLGEATVTDPHNSETLEFIDTRVKGGGMKEIYTMSNLLEKQYETRWYEDLGQWNGQPYSGNSIIIVKLPYTILSDYGGTFSEQEVEEIVNKHQGYGAYASISYYGYVPEVDSFVPDDTEIALSWIDLGAGFTYNVYVSTNNTAFTKDNVSDIVTNSYTIESLTNNLKYYVYVTAVETSTTIEHHPSKTWSGIPYTV